MRATPGAPRLLISVQGYRRSWLRAAKTYAALAGYDIDANRELLGLGAANIGAGLSSGMVVNGSLSKTAVNGSAGARSQVSGLVVAAAGMLRQLGTDLGRDGVRLVVARDVGHVRDVLARTGDPIPVYRTLDEAVVAVADPRTPS